jgi:tetratricopeptide (TPR) repeat protein
VRFSSSHDLRRVPIFGCVALFFILLFSQTPAHSQTLSDAQALYRSGQYAKCLEQIEANTKKGWVPRGWHQLRIKALLTLGKNKEATLAAGKSVQSYQTSVELMMLAYEASRRSGDKEAASAMLRRIDNVARVYRTEYWGPPELAALGDAALALGIEPSRVLTAFYSLALKQDPHCREARLASGRLALDKHDDTLAIKHFTSGVEQHADDPEFHYGLARAHFESERSTALKHVVQALKLNPNHIPSLLLSAEHQFDAEQPDAAEARLKQVLHLNPNHPEAWALRAALAHLRNDEKAYKLARTAALKSWPTNPAVDHLIGRKLSGKYRFAEGAAHQRHALKLDTDHLPAKMQLSLDLLRLGQEKEGWRLAQEVQTRDGYNVVAFNLATLRDHLKKFKTLESEGFIVRMDADEAAIYGNRVLALLAEARKTLSQKYGFKPTQRCVVEIFPDQQDFAIRTFGVPGGSGYLGVCFGNVITANSPASISARASNWQSVLWHEYAHVVTLNLTHNKMPRWLSEGISVYEERQRNPAWGEKLNGRYRQMILGDDLTPVGHLSGAFLSPRSALHLQFAYYESSLVVEYLMEKYGLNAIKAILADLAAGKPINDALTAHTTTLVELEADFESFAKKRAKALAPEIDWTEPDDPEQLATPDGRRQWLKDHPNNFWALMAEARLLMAMRQWPEAAKRLEQLIRLHPTQSTSGNAYEVLAQVYAKMKRPDDERRILEKLASISPNATKAYRRLRTMAEERGDWKTLALNAERTLAVDPLSADAWRHLAVASEQMSSPKAAIAAYQTLLALRVPDRVRVHYRLGRLLKHSDPAAARRHVLEALEQAPRFREAQKLLLELAQPKGESS